MAKYLHPDVLDNGLQHIIDQCSGNVDMLLITSYAQGQAYATVDSNKVMTIDLVAGDFTLGNQGTGRKLTVAEKSGTASGSASSPDLHVAIVDAVASKVLAVTDDTGDADITIGDPKTLPTFDIRMNQPV
jgi:hypothetical protein